MARGMAEWAERDHRPLDAIEAWRVATLALPGHAPTLDHYRDAVTTFATQISCSEHEAELEKILESYDVSDVKETELAEKIGQALERREWPRAIKLARRRLKDHPEDRRIRFGLARACTNFNLLDSGGREFAVLLKDEPKSPLYLHRYALNRARAGDLTRAEQLLRDLEAAAPGNTNIEGQNPATLAASIKSSREAEKTRLPPLLEALRREPESPAAWNALAEYSMKVDLPGRSFACVIRTHSDPGTMALTARIWLALAENVIPASLQAKFIARAEELVEGILKDSPKNAAAHHVRLDACALVSSNEGAYMRLYTDRLNQVIELGLKTEFQTEILYHNVLCAADLAIFDEALAKLEKHSPSAVVLARLRQRREKIVAAQPEYQAAVKALTAVLGKTDYEAIAAAYRSMAKLAPTFACYADSQAGLYSSRAMENWSKGKKGSAAEFFTLAAESALNSEMKANLRAKAVEAGTAARQAVDQLFAEKPANWPAILTAIEEFAKVGPVDDAMEVRWAWAEQMTGHWEQSLARCQRLLAKPGLPEEIAKYLKDILRYLDQDLIKAFEAAKERYEVGWHKEAIEKLRIAVNRSYRLPGPVYLGGMEYTLGDWMLKYPHLAEDYEEHGPQWLYHALAHVEDDRSKLQILQRMAEAGLAPTKEVVDTLNQTWSRAKDDPTKLAILGRMYQSGLPHPPPDAPLGMVATLLQPQVIQFMKAIIADRNAQLDQRAFSWLPPAQQQRIQRISAAWRQVRHVTERRRESEEQVWERDPNGDRSFYDKGDYVTTRGYRGVPRTTTTWDEVTWSWEYRGDRELFDHFWDN